MLNYQRVYFFKVFARVDVKISVQRQGYLFFSLSHSLELVLSNSSQNEAGFSKKWETWSHRPLNIPWGHQLPGHQGGIPTIKISNINVANTQYIVDSIINRHFLGLLHVSFCEREVWMSHIYIYRDIDIVPCQRVFGTPTKKNNMEPTKNGPGRWSSYCI